MAAGLADVLWLLVVGALWGCTNPFLKSGAEGVGAGGNNKQGQPQEPGSVLLIFVQHFTHWRVCKHPSLKHATPALTTHYH